MTCVYWPCAIYGRKSRAYSHFLVQLQRVLTLHIQGSFVVVWFSNRCIGNLPERTHAAWVSAHTLSHYELHVYDYTNAKERIARWIHWNWLFIQRRWSAKRGIPNQGMFNKEDVKRCIIHCIAWTGYDEAWWWWCRLCLCSEAFDDSSPLDRWLWLFVMSLLEDLLMMGMMTAMRPPASTSFTFFPLLRLVTAWNKVV